MTKFVAQTNFTAADMHTVNAEGKVVVSAPAVEKPVAAKPAVTKPVVEEAPVADAAEETAEDAKVAE